VLTGSVALVVLGSAAKVGGGRRLLRGRHGGGGCQGVVVVDGDDDSADRPAFDSAICADRALNMGGACCLNRDGLLRKGVWFGWAMRSREQRMEMTR
jgi:hypothetical protein